LATVIPAFKQSPGKQLPNQKKFNYALSHQRVEVEHCIGILKNHWQSLKLLQNQISGVQSACRANQWIQVFIILHNFLLNDDCDWLLLDPESQEIRKDNPEEDLEDPPNPDSLPNAAEDTQLRTELFDRFCARDMD
jgi:hypothetical protein